MKQKFTTVLALTLAGCATPQYRSTANFAPVQADGTRSTPQEASPRAPLPPRETLDAVYEGLAESCLGTVLDFPQTPQPLTTTTSSPTTGIRGATHVLMDAICEHVGGAAVTVDARASNGTARGDARALLQVIAGPSQASAMDATQADAAAVPPDASSGVSGQRAPGTRRSVSLTPLAINQEALLQLVQQRVRQAELLAVQDILTVGVRGAFAPAPDGAAADANVPFVLRDLTASIAGLLAPTSNAAVDAQHIANEALKVGLVYAIASAAHVRSNDCSDLENRPGEAARCLNLCRESNCDAVYDLGLDAVAVVRALAQNNVRRTHLVAMLRSVDAYVDATLPEHIPDDFCVSGLSRNLYRRARAKNLIFAFTAALRAGIRENDANGPVTLTLDVPAATTSLLAAYSNERYPGWYLRATIGAGYLYNYAERGPEAALYEEIGVGYRWTFANDRFAHGPHIMASGLLHSLVLSGNTSNSVFGGAGYSFNFYRLIDLSANVGAMFDRTNDLKPNFAVTLGLQIPLIDYIEALASGNDAPQVTTASTPR